MRTRSWSTARLASDSVTSRLTVDSDLRLGRISLAGELDRQTAPQLLDAARRIAATEHRDWVFYTHELHFCDASGLRAIAVAYRQALRRGATMTVVGAGGWLRRALATIKLDHHVLAAQPCSMSAVVALAARMPTNYVAPRYPLAKVYAL